MSDTPNQGGWWQASDGKWYPPEQHPDYGRADAPEPTRPGPVEPTRPIPAATESVSRTRVAEPQPVPVRRTFREDVVQLWHERRGFRVAIVVIGVMLVVALIATLAGDADDEPSRVQTGATTSTAPALASTPATTTAPTTVTTAATTTLPATTAPPSTSAPTTTRPPTTSAPATTPTSTTPTTVGVLVTPGSFCAPAGARGVTITGAPVVCTPGSDGRARWQPG